MDCLLFFCLVGGRRPTPAQNADKFKMYINEFQTRNDTQVTRANRVAMLFTFSHFTPSLFARGMSYKVLRLAWRRASKPQRKTHAKHRKTHRHTMMAHTLGGTLQLSENLLCLDKLNATMPLEDVETLLIEEPGVLSSTNSSNDQDEEALASHNNTAKSHRMAEANRRRLYRRSQTRERHELRRQVIDIEKELVLLRRAKENEKAQFNAAQTSTFWFWKSIAAQQRHERFLAEEENQVLTISTHTQTAYIRTLVNIARMPENNPTASRGQDQAVSDHRKQHCGVSETDLFGAFIQGLDTNCNHVDELLQAYRSTPQFEARKPDGTLEYSQLYVKETVPFLLSRTSHFLWQYGIGHRSNFPDFKRYGDVPDPDNTQASSYRSVITLEDGVEISLRNRLVSRRYAEGRVIAWKLVSGGEGVHNGFQFDESGWLFLQESEHGTVIELCIRRTPMHFTNAMPCNRERYEQALHQVQDKTREDVFILLHNVLIDDVFEHLDASDTVIKTIST